MKAECPGAARPSLPGRRLARSAMLAALARVANAEPAVANDAAARQASREHADRIQQRDGSL